MTEYDGLYILWTNDNLDTSQHMVMMYATNSMLNAWWDHVTVIIWGATARLAAENTIIQKRIRLAMQAGVTFTACIACARQLGVADQLKAQGIDVIPWGEPLTTLLKSGKTILTV